MRSDPAASRLRIAARSEAMIRRSKTEAIVVRSSPQALYDLVTDIARVGEWSPICQTCWWDEGDGPSVGSWFTGRNVTPKRTWEPRSEVVAAEPGKEFAWLVGGAYARWGYTFAPVDGGTELTEHWDFMQAGFDRFAELYGDEAQTQIDERTSAAHEGMPVTLAAIKSIAEGDRRDSAERA